MCPCTHHHLQVVIIIQDLYSANSLLSTVHCTKLSKVDFISVVNTANCVYKRLENVFNSSISRCCPEPFYIMKNACKAFSRYSNRPGTPNFEVSHERKYVR
ncbi:unnamed protein product, partial [Staurois parvus]